MITIMSCLVLTHIKIQYNIIKDKWKLRLKSFYPDLTLLLLDISTVHLRCIDIGAQRSVCNYLVAIRKLGSMYCSNICFQSIKLNHNIAVADITPSILVVSCLCCLRRKEPTSKSKSKSCESVASKASKVLHKLI